MSLNADVRVELGPDMKSEKKRALLDLTSNIPQLDSLVHIFNITDSDLSPTLQTRSDKNLCPVKLQA